MTIAEKKQKSLMRRRVRAIVISAVAVLLLAVTLYFVLDFVSTYTYEEGDDTYYIRKRDGVYAMYDADRNLLDTDDEYGYYITARGTLIEVDPETGEYEIIAIVDTEGNEVVGFNSRLLLFPHIEKKNILSIDVHNEHGDYSFVRYNADTGEIDADGDFVIASSPVTTINQELFAELYVGAGYTLSLQKLTDVNKTIVGEDGEYDYTLTAIKDENGEYTEYGLAPEMRKKPLETEEDDFDTEEEDDNELNISDGTEENVEMVDYLYEPAYYVLTDVDGNRYKVLIGDKLVSGNGYYAQYVEIAEDGTETKRDAVYVLDTSTGTALTAPIETYATPMLCYPMTMNTYFDVENFTIGRMKAGATPATKTSELYDKIISFTYIDLSLREGTLQASFPYEFSLELDGYFPNDNNIDACLQSFYSPSYVGVEMLSPTPEDLAKYGIYAPAQDENGNAVLDKDGNPEYTPFSPYTVSFNYDVLDDEGKYSHTLHQLILISSKNKNGNYYAYTAVSAVTEKNGKEQLELLYTYDMVVEIEGHAFAFLEWDPYDWISDSYVHANISFVTDITITSPDYDVTYKLDNSLTASDDATQSTNLTVHATDSKGNEIKSFGVQRYLDVNGFVWEITTSELNVYEASTGKKREIAKDASYYDYNKLGSQVLCKTKVIDCDGYDVEVTADAVNILYDGSTTVKESYVRYDTALFRKFYQTLLYASIVDSYEMSAEKEAALLADESKWILTMTVTTKDVDGTVVTTTYSFYELSNRKAYITVNGNGGFYVQKNRIEKFITDSQRFFNYELIEPTAKK